ncbi:hypothetical protein P12x_001796 [Tundrisphaera lichenicola]|uniref:hypothetical protein n=1 Tax=Tundrisphaera lichenicola TaxID=2029860 RepID=UPI003EB84E11
MPLSAVGTLESAAEPTLPGESIVQVSCPPELTPFAASLVAPETGAEFSQSPTSVTVAFNRPINLDTLGSDLAIIRLDSQGNPISGFQLNLCTFDPDGLQLTGTIPGPLESGHYQVWIAGDSGISDLEGNLLLPDGQPAILGEFSVVIHGIGLTDAIDLGTPGSSTMEISGSLDFKKDPYSVSLYKISLPEGQFWRLGLEVSSQRDGGSLDTALSLFDAQGRLISSDELGRIDAPFDPYLFTGVNPGVYYIGVSGTGNLPDLDGGYDPATGSPGSIPQVQDGGIFRLQIVADPVNAPVSLRAIDVIHADPLDPSPTGLSLQFSGSIQTGGQDGDLSTRMDHGIELVGPDGQLWPVMALSYDESKSRITYLFQDHLEAGRYTIRLPVDYGLVDLAGLSPVAEGQPSRVLGGFDVKAREGAPDLTDLGALRPGRFSVGTAFQIALDPGSSRSYRFVVTFPTIYSFQLSDSGVPIPVRGNGHDLQASIGSRDSSLIGGSNQMTLDPGVYSIRIENNSNEMVDSHFSIIHNAYNELIFKNGVGQGPGLPVRLIYQPPSNLLFTSPLMPFQQSPPRSNSSSITQGSNPTTSPEIPASPVVPPLPTRSETSLTRDSSSQPTIPSTTRSTLPLSAPAPLAISSGGFTTSQPNSETQPEARLLIGVRTSSLPVTTNFSGVFLSLDGELIGRPSLPARQESTHTPPSEVENVTLPVRVSRIAQRNRRGVLSSSGPLARFSHSPLDVISPEIPRDNQPVPVDWGSSVFASATKDGVPGSARERAFVIDWGKFAGFGSKFVRWVNEFDLALKGGIEPALEDDRSKMIEGSEGVEKASSESASGLRVISPVWIGLVVTLTACSRRAVREWLGEAWKSRTIRLSGTEPSTIRSKRRG